MGDLASKLYATDIQAFDVKKQMIDLDYQMFMTAPSKPQAKAIVVAIVREARANWGRFAPKPRASEYGWQVLHFSDLCIHIFNEDLRDYYEIEGNYESCPRLPLPVFEHHSAAPAPIDPAFVHDQPEVDLSQESDFSAVWSTSLNPLNSEHQTASSLAGIDLAQLPTAETTRQKVGIDSDEDFESNLHDTSDEAVARYDAMLGSTDGNFGVVDDRSDVSVGNRQQAPLPTPKKMNASSRPVTEDAFVAHELELDNKMEMDYEGYDVGVGEVLDGEAMQKLELAMAQQRQFRARQLSESGATLFADEVEVIRANEEDFEAEIGLRGASQDAIKELEGMQVKRGEQDYDDQYIEYIDDDDDDDEYDDE